MQRLIKLYKAKLIQKKPIIMFVNVNELIELRLNKLIKRREYLAKKTLNIDANIQQLNKKRKKLRKKLGKKI